LYTESIQNVEKMNELYKEIIKTNEKMNELYKDIQRTNQEWLELFWRPWLTKEQEKQDKTQKEEET
jgi:membrane protein insertase Oxa1/YidC/SpoIIIJ